MTSDKPIYVLTNIWKGFPDSSVGKESVCNAGDPGSIPVWKSPWRRDRLPTPVFLGFSCVSAGKESACSVGDLDSTPGLGRSCLEHSMDCLVHGVTKSLTGLSHFCFISIFRK